jgi:hypothetical protein
MAESRVIDPEALGKGKGIHWLTHEKANLHRVGSRDDLGRPVEVKVPRMRSEVMLDTDGNEVDVAVETGRTRSKASYDKYGKPHREQMFLEHGFLPRSECPLTRRYGPPLIRPADSEVECQNIPDGGCSHYRKARDGRRAEAKAKAKERKAVMGAVTEAQARNFVVSLQAMAGALGEQPAGPRGRGAKPSKPVDESNE